jgi:hypothetical protein
VGALDWRPLLTSPAWIARRKQNRACLMALCSLGQQEVQRPRREAMGRARSCCTPLSAQSRDEPPRDRKSLGSIIRNPSQVVTNCKNRRASHKNTVGYAMNWKLSLRAGNRGNGRLGSAGHHSFRQHRLHRRSRIGIALMASCSSGHGYSHHPSR